MPIIWFNGDNGGEEKVSKNPLVTLAEILSDDRRDLQKDGRRSAAMPSGPCGRLRTLREASAPKKKRGRIGVFQ